VTESRLVDVLVDALSRIARARESLADGDVSLAEQLLGDLQDDLWKTVEPRRPLVCAECGARFDFAGALDHHTMVTHDLQFTHGAEDGS
jgi:hypothetical protein